KCPLNVVATARMEAACAMSDEVRSHVSKCRSCNLQSQPPDISVNPLGSKAKLEMRLHFTICGPFSFARRSQRATDPLCAAATTYPSPGATATRATGPVLPESVRTQSYVCRSQSRTHLS